MQRIMTGNTHQILGEWQPPALSFLYVFLVRLTHFDVGCINDQKVVFSCPTSTLPSFIFYGPLFFRFSVQTFGIDPVLESLCSIFVYIFRGYIYKYPFSYSELSYFLISSILFHFILKTITGVPLIQVFEIPDISIFVPSLNFGGLLMLVIILAFPKAILRNIFSASFSSYMDCSLVSSHVSASRGMSSAKVKHMILFTDPSRNLPLVLSH